MKWVNLIFILLAVTFQDLNAQNGSIAEERQFFLLEQRLGNSTSFDRALQDTTDRNEYPEPKSVMFKSMMIPGWGQIVNKQTWKVL